MDNLTAQNSVIATLTAVVAYLFKLSYFDLRHKVNKCEEERDKERKTCDERIDGLRDEYDARLDVLHTEIKSVYKTIIDHKNESK